MELPRLSLIVLDTETTGFIPRVNRVIEFASVRIENGTVTERFEQLISIPKNDVPPVVQVLTRIRPSSLEGQPTMEQAREKILEQIKKGTMIVGQNTSFDLKMLKGEGIDLTDYPWIDTSMLASLVFPELASYSLGYVSTVLGLNHTPVHRAMGDVVATLELLSRCWERILELPEDMLETLRDIFSRSAPGYRLLAEVLPKKARTKKEPAWLTSVTTEKSARKATNNVHIEPADLGTVQLIEDSLNARNLSQIIEKASKEKSPTWIGVKNLEAAQRRLRPLPADVHVLHPPFLLVDTKAVEKLLAQETFTADEATLALKLVWYKPRAQEDLPIHGDERSVWSGKIAATEASDVYTKQFRDLKGTVLLDQRQLLSLLSNPDHAAHGALTKDTHIVIDDASLLEDTATKALGWSVHIDALRAAAEGNKELTGFTDLLQIWIERTRNFQDLRYLAPSDLGSKEAEALRERIDLLDLSEAPPLLKRTFEHLRAILDPINVEGSISWIEQRQNGSQYLESVPERVGERLQTILYKSFRTTLMLAPGMMDSFKGILPPGTRTTIASTHFPAQSIALEISETASLEEVMKNPPPGKTVVLIGSRRIIEDAFVRHTETLEEKDVTLICQSLSGGQERMQAEFMAAPGQALWLLTPWTYEGVELPSDTVQNLVLFTLPFDHPDHPVLSRRAVHYRDPFSEVALPRLKARLFRLLRTFARHSTSDATVIVSDERLRTKNYGKEVRKYLEQFTEETSEKTAAQMQLL